MMKAKKTKQEKREFAGINGFLVEVWRVERSKTASRQFRLQKAGRTKEPKVS